MKKLKLFLAACAAMVSLGVNAQEDITSQYLTNADLSEVNTGWTYYSDSFKYTDWKIDGDVPVVEFYSQWNAGNPVSITQKDFKFSQTVTLPAGDYRIAVNAFYRNGAGDGTNDNKAWIFAGDKKQNVFALTSAGVASYTGSNDLYKAANAFSLGDFSNAFDFSLESETQIDLGFQGFFNTSLSWCILGPVKLYKYSLDDYLVDYDAKYAEAEAINGQPMNADVQSALTAAMVDRSTFSLSSEVTAAIAALTAAVNNANTSIGVYSSINSAISSYATSAAALDEAGAAAYDASSVQTNYNNGMYATLAEAETDLAAALLSATKAQTTEGSNWTGIIINPSFESDFSIGWTNTGSFDRQNNTSFAKTGTYYAEVWQPNGTKTLTQTLTAMPSGVYRLTAHAKARGVTSARIFAAGVDKAITVADSDDDYSVEFACDDNADVEIGFEGIGTGAGSSWICVDNFRLTLVSAGLPDVTAAEGKMNASIAEAQANAISSYNAGKTVAGYNAAQAAIAAAEASIAAYVPFTAAINKIDAALTAATSATASTEAYDAVKSTYTNGSVADADIQSSIITAYNAVIPVIKSQTAANADFTLAIQNQSFEYGDMTGWTAEASSDTGVRETSNATYAATGSDGNYLFNTWWKGNPITQAVTNLPNGQYTLTVSVASDGATIYLIANGGHNEGTETGGTYPSSDTFQEANFTFLVKDGSATIGAVGGADGTAGEHKDYVEGGYWWYKADNFRLVKNRELTEEEVAVVPTGVTLDKTEVTLTATEPSVTLTPTFEPENATNTVTWTTSDANVATVADGVVTAVAPGTATITVTSTLDENVKASCEVTVSFPESTVPATIEYAEGPALTVYTLSQNNLLKNGTFGYPNAVATWKTVGYTTDAVASNFTITAEGGAVDGGAFITTNAGGAGAVTTLRKSVPVEVGKKYYFSVYTSGKAPASNNFQYNALFKMSDAVTESGTLKEFEWPQGANNETTEWSKTEFVFTAETPYVGVRMGWNASSSFDEFVLAEITDEATVGNVQYALDAIPTSNIGTGAFQYSQDAIDAANALVQGTATVEDVTNAYNAVTTLNVPEATQAYNLVFNCEGHNYTGNALTLIPNSAQTQGLYGLKYLAPANVNLAQAFYFTHTTGNKYKVHAIDTDLKERYITTQAEGYGTTWYEGIRTIDDASKAMEIEIRPNGEGLYLMWNTGANKPLGHNGNNNNDLFTNNTANFQFVETQKPSITINTTGAGWGTTMLPFAVAEIPEGVKVYSCAEATGATLTLVEVEALEANKPYIIEGAWEATLTGDAQGTALSYTEGLLTGTYVEMNAEALDGKYIMQKQNEKVGFFLVNSANAQPKLKANRAYMTAPATGSVKAFLLGDDAADAIQSVFDGLVNGDAYDLGGRKVSKLQKGGVYIVNGKKVIVK